MWNFSTGRDPEPMGTPSVEISYQSGTREIEKAVVSFAHPSGQEVRVITTPLRTLYIAAGTGYFQTPEWGHGLYKGPLTVEGLTFDMSTPELRRPYAVLNETLCRFELSTGEIGYGMHENMCIGIYHPNGFHTADAVAP